MNQYFSVLKRGSKPVYKDSQKASKIVEEVIWIFLWVLEKLCDKVSWIIGYWILDKRR